MASSNIRSDIISISLLAYRYCEAGGDLSRYLVSDYDVLKAAKLVEDLTTDYIANRAGRYIDLMIVKNAKDAEHVLYTGTQRAFTFTTPDITTKFLEQFPLQNGFYVYPASQSIFFPEEVMALNMAAPVYAPNNKTFAGKMYFSVNTNIINDKLMLVSDSADSLFYLTIQNEHYLVGDGHFEKIEYNGSFTSEKADYLSNNGNDLPIEVGKVRFPNGAVMNAVTCQVRDDMSLLLAFPLQISAGMPFVWAIAAVSLLIVALAGCVIIVMHRTVALPIEKIRSAIGKISTGDFQSFPEIESDSEIGEVGRGINHMSRSVSDLLTARLADERERRELEYKLLQNQIKPHFIYNTLNTIRWMAKFQDAEDIAKLSEALSRMLRTMAKDLRRVVPIRDELALLNDYCTILNYRYGETVDILIIVEDELLYDCLLPRFVLQPLVENAVFHGIEPRGYGKVRISVSRKNEAVALTVADDGIGMSEEAKAAFEAENVINENGSSEPIGMRNVHKRIEDLFGKPYGLSLCSSLGNTEAVILIPFENDRRGDDFMSLNA